MGSLLQLVFFAALSLAVQGREFRASHLSNRRDVSDLCESSAATDVSCDDMSSEDGLQAHPDDCRLFYQCVSAGAPPVCRQCPAGLHFSPGARTCDLPERAACKSAAGPVDTAPAPRNEIPPRCINNTVTAVSCANATVLDGLLPHPDDCELFYYCVSPESEPICRQCNAGLHFNPTLHVCDAPERAGCASERAPAPASWPPGAVRSPIVARVRHV